MNGYTQGYAAGNGSAHQARHSIDSVPGAMNGTGRAQGGPAMPMPVRSGTFGGMPGEGTAGAVPGPFPGPRSPPKNKSRFIPVGAAQAARKQIGSKNGAKQRTDTAHVPCKFFLQGQCQAGRTCPFSHDPDSSMRPAPCKYFAKGGCKFGRKCALLHITPDGNVVNRGGAGGYMVQPQQQHQHQPQPMFAPPVQNGGPYPPAPPGLLSQGLEQRPNGENLQEDYQSYSYGLRNGYDAPDMTYTSASPQYGSPPNNDRFASSPPAKGLSVLDAPLPSSFDSQGISMAARNGPFASSVPSRFGLESPPSSSPHKAHMGNTALRDLHSTAFGNDGLDGRLAGLGSSPPSGTDEPLTFPKRSLHSERLRASRPMVSASLGTGGFPTQAFQYLEESDEAADTDREEDCLPASLHDLIPEGRSRKESRARQENTDDTPAAFLASQRRTISSHGTTSLDNKVGSPHSSSPSRYSGTFARMASASKENTETSTFPTVGSPLRNQGFTPSSFFTASQSPTNSRPSNGDLSPGISSPPKQASMSMLTQELQRTRIDAARAASTSQTQSPVSYAGAAARSLSLGGLASNAPARKSLDRAVSTGSVGRERIEEEEVFSMDDTGK